MSTPPALSCKFADDRQQHTVCLCRTWVSQSGCIAGCIDRARAHLRRFETTRGPPVTMAGTFGTSVRRHCAVAVLRAAFAGATSTTAQPKIAETYHVLPFVGFAAVILLMVLVSCYCRGYCGKDDDDRDTQMSQTNAFEINVRKLHLGCPAENSPPGTKPALAQNTRVDRWRAAFLLTLHVLPSACPRLPALHSTCTPMI